MRLIAPVFGHIVTYIERQSFRLPHGMIAIILACLSWLLVAGLVILVLEVAKALS